MYGLGGGRESESDRGAVEGDGVLFVIVFFLRQEEIFLDIMT